MVTNSGSEAAEGDVRRYFGGNKGTATRIWQEWQGWGGEGRLHKLIQGEKGHIILGRRQAMPGWEDDTEWGKR